MISNAINNTDNVDVLVNDDMECETLMSIPFRSKRVPSSINLQYRPNFGGYVLELGYKDVGCIINIMSGEVYIKESSDPELRTLNLMIPAMLKNYYDSTKVEYKKMIVGEESLVH